MTLFRHRPLAAAALALIVAVAFLYFLPFSLGLPLFILSIVILLSVFLYCRKKKFAGKALTLFLVILFVTLGFSRGYLDRFSAERLFEKHLDSTVEAELLIDDISFQSVYSSELYVKVLSINGERCRSQAVLRTSGIAPFYIGDLVSGSFLCKDLSFEAFHEGTKRSYLGEGARVILVPEGDIILTKSGTESFAAKRADLAASLSFRIRNAVEGKGGELLSALLIGDREHLSEETVRDFRRIGISHLLAISGLHLSVLCGAADYLLRACRVHKRWRLFATLFLSALYFILTGGSISILRAAFMLGMVQLSFLLRTDNDAFTSLSLSAAILVLLTPTLIFNLSFLMTMLATVGILSFGELQGLLLRRLPKREGKLRIPIKLLSTLITSLILTCSSTLALLPVQWLIFGELSLLTPLSNLVFVPLALPLLILAILTLALSPFSAISHLLSIPVGLFSHIVLRLAEELSRWDAVISLRQNFTPYVLLPLMILTAILLCVDLKRLKPLVFAPLLIAGIAFAICLGVTYHHGAAHMDVIYRRAGENEEILLYQNGSGVILDLSGGSYSQLSSSYYLLAACGAPEVDALIYTHYHSTMPTALSKFSKSTMLRSIYLPFPTSEQEVAIFNKMISVADEQRVGVTVYERDAALMLENGTELLLTKAMYNDRSSEPTFALTITFTSEEARYETSSYREYLIESGGSAPLVTAEYLILGAHGPVPKITSAVVTAEETKRVLIGDREILESVAWRGGGHVELFPEFYYFRMNRP